MAPGVDGEEGCIVQQRKHGQVVTLLYLLYLLYVLPCAVPFHFGPCLWQARDTIQMVGCSFMLVHKLEC